MLMDYARRRRLKVWVRVVDPADDPELVARLELPGYRAQVVRMLVTR